MRYAVRRRKQYEPVAHQARLISFCQRTSLIPDLFSTAPPCASPPAAAWPWPASRRSLDRHHTPASACPSSNLTVRKKTTEDSRPLEMGWEHLRSKEWGEHRRHHLDTQVHRPE